MIQITQPGRDHLPLILNVNSIEALRGKVQISILKDIAQEFQLEAFREIDLHVCMKVRSLVFVILMTRPM